MNNIGILYEYGGHGVTKNLATCASWYRKAAEAGSADGQHNLGLCYYKGKGVTKNLRVAVSWYQKSANQDNVDAIRRLGTMMVKGEGGAKQVSKGAALWERAAAMNDQKSQANLQLMNDQLSGCIFQ